MVANSTWLLVNCELYERIKRSECFAMRRYLMYYVLALGKTLRRIFSRDAKGLVKGSGVSTA